MLFWLFVTIKMCFQWDLVCDQKHMSWTATSIYFAGVMVGGIIFGTLSDKIGRLPVMAFTLFMPLVFGTMLYFVENLVLFIIIRCLIGVLMQVVNLYWSNLFGLSCLGRPTLINQYIYKLMHVLFNYLQGLQTTSYVMGMELFCTSKYRAITAALFETCWALGVMSLACIAYLLKHWRWIQLGITLPTVLSIIYIW